MDILKIKTALSEALLKLGLDKLLSYGRNEVLGLDIGSSTVKFAQLRKNGERYCVAAAGIADIEKGDGNDPIQTETATVKAIQQCLDSSGTATRLCVCGVCGPEVAVRSFSFPALPSEEIEGAVMLEASQVCPFSIDDYTVDYQLTPNSQEGVQGILVAATNRLIRKKSRLAKDASLSCVLMDVDGLALLNCLEQYKRVSSRTTTAVLNIGRALTTLAMTGENNQPFIRDIAYAGDDIIKHIASERGTSPEAANRDLYENDTNHDSEPGINKSLADACRRLVADVNETLRYYSAQEKNAVVEKIYLCGGFSLVKGLAETLDNQLDASVELWNPLENIRCNNDNGCEYIIRKKGPALAVAAGLAMRSI